MNGDELSDEKIANMKRYSEVFQEMNNQRKLINQDIRDTRESYIIAGDLSKEEIKQVERATKLLKGKVDLEDLLDVSRAIEDKVQV